MIILYFHLQPQFKYELFHILHSNLSVTSFNIIKEQKENSINQTEQKRQGIPQQLPASPRARELALQYIRRAKRAAPHTRVSFRVLLSRDFSRLLQIESLLVGYRTM